MFLMKMRFRNGVCELAPNWIVPWLDVGDKIPLCGKVLEEPSIRDPARLRWLLPVWAPGKTNNKLLNEIPNEIWCINANVIKNNRDSNYTKRANGNRKRKRKRTEGRFQTGWGAPGRVKPGLVHRRAGAPGGTHRRVGRRAGPGTTRCWPCG